MSQKVPGKRRNGKIQACEPCRKRKLVCDHATPCKRCVKRGSVEHCFYHPAPLTRTAAKVLPLSSPNGHVAHSPSPSQPSQNQQSEIVQQRCSETIQDVSRDSISYTAQIKSPGVSSTRDSIKAPTPRPSGFLGDSSASAVVAEVLGSLGISHPEETPEILQGSVSEPDICQGVEVLAYLQDFDLITTFVEYRTRITDSYILFNSVYFTWLEPLKHLLKTVPHKTTLKDLSTMIWRNTQQPFPGKYVSNVEEWALRATGENLRWESLGLILSCAGLVAGSLPGFDPIFARHPARDRITMIRTTRRLADSCLAMCNQCNSRNELVVHLMYDSLLLAERVEGDLTSGPWTKMGETCDMAVYLGIHQARPDDRTTPFFLTAFRARIFSAIYRHDKFIATFLGRPPRISHRHCDVQMPLDLSDEQICLPEPELSKVIAQLDNGWNRTGALYRTTWRRAKWEQLNLREDLLELILAPPSRNVDAQIEHLRAQSQAVHERMPEFITNANMDELWNDPSRNHLRMIPGRGVPWQPMDVMAVTFVHILRRHIDFVLERAVVNRQRRDPTALIQASLVLTRHALKVYGVKDYLREYQIDILDMLIYYALPAAGVLAVELLKRDQLHDPDDSFPRSETIQLLSVLASALEAVNPEEGNYNLCAMGLNAVRKTLDRTLSRPPQRANCPVAGPDLLDDFQFGLPVNATGDADFMQWLGHVDFATDSWLDGT